MDGFLALAMVLIIVPMIFLSVKKQNKPGKDDYLIVEASNLRPFLVE